MSAIRGFAIRRPSVVALVRLFHAAVSSYGPTYGLVRDNGRSLYIADATYGRDSPSTCGAGRRAAGST